MSSTAARTAPAFRAVRTPRNAVFVTFTLSGIAIATWLGRVPTVRDSLHASTGEMSILVVAMSVGSILGLSLAGHVVSALGARQGVRIASGCLFIGMVAAGVVVSGSLGFPALLVCLFVFGLGNGLCDVSMNVSGASVERAGGRTVMPLFHAAFSLGSLAGAGIGSLAEAANVPVVWHFLVTAVVVAGAMLVATTRFVDERAENVPTDTSPVPVGGTSRWAVWAMPGTILIGVIVLGMALAEGSANDWLALAMVDGHGLDDAGGTAVLSVFVAAMTIGRIAGTFVIDRFGRVPVLRASAILAGIGLAMLVFVPSTPIAVVGVVLWGLGASLGFPVGMSAAAEDSRNAAARVSAVATIGYCAFLVGPLLIGFLGERIGLLHALLVVLLFIVAAGVVSGAARERGDSAARRSARDDLRAGGEARAEGEARAGGEARLPSDAPEDADPFADPASTTGQGRRPQ